MGLLHFTYNKNKKKAKDTKLVFFIFVIFHNFPSNKQILTHIIGVFGYRAREIPNGALEFSAHLLEVGRRSLHFPLLFALIREIG